jgi:hypothetical protein
MTDAAIKVVEEMVQEMVNVTKDHWDKQTMSVLSRKKDRLKGNVCVWHTINPKTHKRLSVSRFQNKRFRIPMADRLDANKWPSSTLPLSHTC